MFKFGERSEKNLKDVHSELQRLMREALKTSPYDFAITEGIRTAERQLELYQAGKSLTMLSRHLTGKAIDLMIYVNGKGTWEGKYYDELSVHILQKAKELNIPITWGGTFRSLADKVHYELRKQEYP